MEFDRYLEATLQQDKEEDERTIRLMFNLSERLVRGLRFLDSAAGDLGSAEGEVRHSQRFLDETGITVRTTVPNHQAPDMYFTIAIQPILSYHDLHKDKIRNSVNITLSCGNQVFLSGTTCSSESLLPQKIALFLLKKAKRAGLKIEL